MFVNFQFISKISNHLKLHNINCCRLSVCVPSPSKCFMEKREMRSPLKENVQVKRVRTNQTDDLLLVPIRRVTPVKLVPIQPAPQMVDTSSSSVITSKARRSLGGDFSKKVHICHLVKKM